MDEREVLELLALAGAILTDDHFVYTAIREDGKRWHGTGYVAKDELLPEQGLLEELCWEMAWRFNDVHVDAVIGPVAGGVAYAYETAKHIGPNCLRMYADKAAGGKFVVKRGFDRRIRGKNVLVVEDILTTGGSAAAVVHAVRDAGGIVVGVAALCNRGGVTAKAVGVERLECLVNITMEAWPPDQCPMCAQGVQVNTQYGHGAEFLAAQTRLAQ